jgi:outer membrane receptor protein involved in Fe transport
VTAGFRYAKTDVSFNHLSDGAQNFIGQNASGGGQHDKPFTSKLGLSWQIDPDNMVYTTYAKGYRIGGANPYISVAACAADLANLGLSAAPDSYKSDFVNSFEVGAKNRPSDSLRLASSLYYIKWSGIQQNIYLPGCGFQFTANTGEAVAKGFDVQAEWAVTPSFAFETAIGYTDARYAKDFTMHPGAPLTVRAGDSVVGESGTPTPPWTITLGAQYDFEAFNHKSYVRGDFEYQSHNNWLTPAEDGSPGNPASSTAQYAGGYAYTPAATRFVTIRAGQLIDKWNVSAFVDNLFNTHPSLPPSSYAYSDQDKVAPAGMAGSSLLRSYTFRPRTLGVTATYHF